MNHRERSMEMSRDPWLRSADRLKPYLGVLFLQLGYAFNGIIVKSALNKGLNPCTFSVYRNIAAVIAFGPFALYFERKLRPQMTLSVFLKIMLLAQLELEKVNIRRLHSQGKIIGTFVTVGGAMVMTLVNGPPIPLPWTNLSRVHHPRASEEPSQADHLKGAIMITAGCFFWASFYILQAVTLKKYPAQLSLTTLICTMGALQGTVMTLVIEKGKTGIWSIKWDTKLLATLYSGIVRSGASYYISGLVMKEKGPFFVTAFNPLGMVIVVI
ncbi:hypothetical protein Ccrd_011791, partial [Cynara cardunculus var. scolymus]